MSRRCFGEANGHTMRTGVWEPRAQGQAVRLDVSADGQILANTTIWLSTEEAHDLAVALDEAANDARSQFRAPVPED